MELGIGGYFIIAIGLVVWAIIMVTVYYSAEWPWFVRREEEYEAEEEAKMALVMEKCEKLAIEVEAQNAKAEWTETKCTQMAFAEKKIMKEVHRGLDAPYTTEYTIYRCKLVNGKCCDWIDGLKYGSKRGCPNCNIALGRRSEGDKC